MAYEEQEQLQVVQGPQVRLVLLGEGLVQPYQETYDPTTTHEQEAQAGLQL